MSIRLLEALIRMPLKTHRAGSFCGNLAPRLINRTESLQSKLDRPLCRASAARILTL